MQSNDNMKNLKLGFFGTPHLSVWVLDELESQGILPSLVVTNPDTPQGRKMLLTPTPVAVWAEARNIPVLKLPSLKTPEVENELKASGCELFIVAAYGKLIPQNILDIPKYKTLNTHPSLLPLLRGASPVRSAILQDMNPTGVTIMELTAGMDEGPILVQEEVSIPDEAWPIRGNELDEILFKKGGKILAEVLPSWINGEIAVQEQDHDQATYCTKITKEMGELDLTADPYQNLLKIRAFDGWPGTFFFTEKNGEKIRVKIVDAELDTNGSLNILRIIPEGKREMDYKDFN
jgi:methionyl-tRNA formyltransferase